MSTPARPIVTTSGVAVIGSPRTCRRARGCGRATRARPRRGRRRSRPTDHAGRCPARGRTTRHTPPPPARRRSRRCRRRRSPGDVHAGRDRVRVGQLTALHLAGQVLADVLEVHVPDPPRVGNGDGHGFPPPMSRWPVSRHRAMRLPASTRSVSAPDSTIVPTWGCSVASSRCAAAASAMRSSAARRVDHCASSSTGRCRTRLHRSRRRGRRSRRRRRPAEPSPPRQRAGVVPGVMQDDRDELAHRPEAGIAKDGCLRLGRLREEAVRTELGCRKAHLAHLGEDVGWVQLVPPPGHLTHTPGDGGAGDTVAQRGCRRGSHLVALLRSSGCRTGRRVVRRDGTACTPRRPGTPPVRRGRCTGWALRRGRRRGSGSAPRGRPARSGP